MEKANGSNLSPRGLENAKSRNKDGVLNPWYSPVVPRKCPEQAREEKEAEYMEMGVINDGFQGSEKKKATKLNSFNQEVSLNISDINLHKKIDPMVDDDNYLTPTSSSKRPPISPMVPMDATRLDPHYEDLNQVAAKVRTDTTTSSTFGQVLPKRKTNMIYEPSAIKKKKSTTSTVDYMEYDVPCWLIAAVLIIGVIAIVAVILFILLVIGTVKSKKCSCDADAGLSAYFYGKFL